MYSSQRSLGKFNLAKEFASFATADWNTVQTLPCVNVSLRSASHSLSLPSTDATFHVFSLFSFSCSFVPTDTAAKLQAVKEKARQANDTAKAVLAQVKDLHQNLDGLRENYNKLADSVAKTNAVVKDPSRNSKISFLAAIVSFILSHRESGPDSWVVEPDKKKTWSSCPLLPGMGVKSEGPAISGPTSLSFAWEPF